jgi:hypothetical protein
VGLCVGSKVGSDGLLVGCPLGCGGTVGAAGAAVSGRVRVGSIVGIAGNGGIDSRLWLLLWLYERLW